MRGDEAQTAEVRERSAADSDKETSEDAVDASVVAAAASPSAALPEGAGGPSEEPVRGSSRGKRFAVRDLAARRGMGEMARALRVTEQDEVSVANEVCIKAMFAWGAGEADQ